MCVIMIADGTRPTVEMVDKAFEKNPVGAGVAWREKEFVRWKKGLDRDELQELVAKLPMPFIMHCRIDTCGGESKELTHPFVVSKQTPLILNGKTKGYMMFHNGHWNPWKDKLLDIAIKSNVPLPGGKWSDSRAMAFTASIYGITALELIDEKAAVLSPDDLQAFGTGWAKVNDVWCSNKLWENIHVTTHYRSKREEVTFSEKKIEAVVKNDAKTRGSSPQETFCSSDGGLQCEEDLSEGMEASPQSLRGVQKEYAERATHQRVASDGAVVTVFGITPTEQAKLKDLVKEGTKAIEDIRALNPSRFRRPLTQESVDYDLRKENARKGITTLGRL